MSSWQQERQQEHTTKQRPALWNLASGCRVAQSFSMSHHCNQLLIRERTTQSLSSAPRCSCQPQLSRLRTVLGRRRKMVWSLSVFKKGLHTCIHTHTHAQTRARTHTHRQTCTNKQRNNQTNKQTIQTDGRTDGQTGKTDGRTDGRLEKQMHIQQASRKTVAILYEPSFLPLFNPRAAEDSSKSIPQWRIDFSKHG